MHALAFMVNSRHPNGYIIVQLRLFCLANSHKLVKSVKTATIYEMWRIIGRQDTEKDHSPHKSNNFSALFLYRLKYKQTDSGSTKLEVK